MATYGSGLRIKGASKYNGAIPAASTLVHTVSGGNVYAVITLGISGTTSTNTVRLRIDDDIVGVLTGNSSGEIVTGSSNQTVSIFVAAGSTVKIDGDLSNGSYYLSVVEFENGS